jgi:hypothetical protein
LLLYLFWISLRLGMGVYNTLASKICVKLLKSPEIQISTPNTFQGSQILDLQLKGWFKSKTSI